FLSGSDVLKPEPDRGTGVAAESALKGRACLNDAAVPIGDGDADGGLRQEVAKQHAAVGQTRRGP
ncbi:MAG TPA: hypothetical protein VGA17_08045, partial [Nitrospiraceae bacterium]